MPQGPGGPLPGRRRRTAGASRSARRTRTPPGSSSSGRCRKELMQRMLTEKGYGSPTRRSIIDSRRVQASKHDDQRHRRRQALRSTRSISPPSRLHEVPHGPRLSAGRQADRQGDRAHRLAARCRRPRRCSRRRPARSPISSAPASSSRPAAAAWRRGGLGRRLGRRSGAAPSCSACCRRCWCWPRSRSRRRSICWSPA